MDTLLNSNNKEYYIFSKSEINSLLHALSEKISSISSLHMSQFKYGYNIDVPVLELGTVALTYYNSILKYIQDGTCLKDCQLQLLVENALGFVGKSCEHNWKDPKLTTDTSKLNDWIAINPNSVPKEKYEQLALVCLGGIGFNLEVNSVKNLCELFYDYSSKKINDEIIAMVSVYKKNCNVETHVTASTMDCDMKLELKSINDNFNCNLNIDKFTSLRKECNMPLDLISKVYECGLNLDIDSVTETCPILQVGTRAYNLCDTLFDLKNTKK